MIITDRNQIDNTKILLCTSVGGSPITNGHTRLIRDCKPAALKYLREDLGLSYESEDNLRLLVIVNCNDFLVRKHGFVFQDENERAEILDSIKTVDYTFIHQSDKQTVDDTLHYFQPHYFLKGGDRSSRDAMPSTELQACDDYGTVLIFGVGGTDKVSSSSELIKRAVEHYSYEAFHELWERN